MSTRLLVCVATSAALGGCQALVSSLTPVGLTGSNGRTSAVSGTGGYGTGSYGNGRTPLGYDTTSVSRPRNRNGRGAAPRGDLATRRQCRAELVPSGWLVVSYEASSGDCPARTTAAHDSVATVAVIVRYVNAPIGTVLDMCANQPVPAGWTRLSDEAPDDSGACPGAARGSDPTAIRIRRDF